MSEKELTSEEVKVGSEILLGMIVAVYLMAQFPTVFLASGALVIGWWIRGKYERAVYEYVEEASNTPTA